jgi:cyclophilin family peptidyl-prolyl cis-trans isomerase
LYFWKTPMTVASYVGLAEGTLGPEPRKPYYEGVKWHRVVPDFVVQGGDGGRIGYQFPDEIVPGLRHDSIGVLQMANGGPDSNGSQYCLMLSPQQRLNYLHTVFGHVVRGLEVLPKIQQGDTMHVRILRLGEAAEEFRADDEAFAEFLIAAKRYNGPREPGPDTPFYDPDGILPRDIPRARHFNFKLANYQRFTGRKIAARVFAKPPSGAEPDKLDDYLSRESARLGVADEGAFAVYFADQDVWHLRIAAKSLNDFVSRSQTGEPLKKRQSLAQAEQDFLSAARSQAEEFIAKAQKNAPPDRPLTAGQKIKFQVDAVLDGLIFKLEPRYR